MTRRYAEGLRRYLRVTFGVLLLAGCGKPLTTCTLNYGADQYHTGQRCPNNTVLVGTSGTQLICAAVSAACPIEGGNQ